MKLFVAGATSLIGIRLIPLLVEMGHTVAGMTRFAAKSDTLDQLGAEPIVCDVYDIARLTAVVAGFKPDIVIHQLTDLPDDARDLPAFRVANSRIRRAGTRNLLTAAYGAGTAGFIAQSVAWELPGDWGAAVTDMENAVLAFGGVVVRYGQFFGPGTYYERQPPNHPRIHIHEAARRTVPALQLSHTTITVIEDPRLHAP